MRTEPERYSGLQAAASPIAAAIEHEHQRRRADRQDAWFPAGAEARDRLPLAVAGAARQAARGAEAEASIAPGITDARDEMEQRVCRQR